jgi:hypothetical protein
VKTTATLFDAGVIVPRAAREAAKPVVTVCDDQVTGLAGAALWGPLLDRLGVVAEADRRRLRPIGSGGYSGGECYRALVEVLLAGGDFLSDRSLLAGEATEALRGAHRLPSHTTMWRFCAGADLGRVAKAAAVNRAMLARAWAMGAGPTGGLITIDPDATLVATYGPTKEGSAFSYTHQVGLSPMIGVCGETGDVIAVRGRGGSANVRRGLASFIDECVAAIPGAVRATSQLWVRIDSAGYNHQVFAACERHGAVFTITAKKHDNVRAVIEALAMDGGTEWRPALGAEGERGSQVAETTIVVGARHPEERTLRLIVRRQRTSTGDQLSFDDIDGWRFHAFVTNLPPDEQPAEQVEHHHRLRGGIPEDAVRQLKEDFGLDHAPVENFFGNWLWWQACALAHNTARWLRVLAFPEEFHRCRGKRLRLAFLNVAGRVVHHGRRVHLRLAGSHPWSAAFVEALTRVRALPAFA